jgi:hypothetical protein
MSGLLQAPLAGQSGMAPFGVLQAFEVALSLDTSAYASGDLLADTQVIPGVMLWDGGDRELRSIDLTDESAQGRALDLLFLRANVSLGTENSAVSLAAASGRHIVGVVSVSAADWVTVGSCKKAFPIGWPPITLEAPAGSRDIYVAAVFRDTTGGTYAANALRVRLGVM